jgi:FtsP/CotA-like multicopper oxidase with cupredoxin domain
VLVLDDILLDDDGQVAPRDEGPAMTPDGKLMTFESMMGRQGNRLLLNGAPNPFIEVTKGTVERWRIVNVANSRFFKLALAGHAFVVIGTDVGFVPAPKVASELMIAPGERYDLLVEMTGDVEQQIPLVTKHHDRGHDMADPGDLAVATIRYAAAAQVPATPLPSTTRDIERLAPESVPDQTVKMEETLLRGAKVGFSLNGEMWPDVTPLSAALGSIETWEIVNETHMDHPFHLHGFPFQVVDRAPLGEGARVPEELLAWKDVVIVGPEERLRFVVRYDGFPGMWMLHCHILEHAERGMMTMIAVE